MRRSVFLTATAMVLFAMAAAAQESRSEISVQGTGFLTQSATGNGTSYDATQTAGVLGTYRYRLNHWLSAEGAYGFERNTQKYALNSTDFRIQSNLHQFTGGLVFALPVVKRRFSPYLLTGGGILLFDPTGSDTNNVFGSQTQARGVFQYGGGVDYPILRRVSLRAEYRGLIYSTPDFSFSTLRTNSITHTAEPSIGLAFHF